MILLVSSFFVPFVDHVVSLPSTSDPSPVWDDIAVNRHRFLAILTKAAPFFGLQRSRITSEKLIGLANSAVLTTISKSCLRCRKARQLCWFARHALRLSLLISIWPFEYFAFLSLACDKYMSQAERSCAVESRFSLSLTKLKLTLKRIEAVSVVPDDQSLSAEGSVVGGTGVGSGSSSQASGETEVKESSSTAEQHSLESYKAKQFWALASSKVLADMTVCLLGSCLLLWCKAGFLLLFASDSINSLDSRTHFNPNFMPWKDYFSLSWLLISNKWNRLWMLLLLLPLLFHLPKVETANLHLQPPSPPVLSLHLPLLPQRQLYSFLVSLFIWMIVIFKRNNAMSALPPSCVHCREIPMMLLQRSRKEEMMQVHICVAFLLFPSFVFLFLFSFLLFFSSLPFFRLAHSSSSWFPGFFLVLLSSLWLLLHCSFASTRFKLLCLLPSYFLFFLFVVGLDKQISKALVRFAVFCIDRLSMLENSVPLSAASSTSSSPEYRQRVSLAQSVVESVLIAMQYNSLDARERFPRLLSILNDYHSFANVTNAFCVCVSSFLSQSFSIHHCLIYFFFPCLFFIFLFFIYLGWEN